jgi:hypothetical protein
MNKSLHIIILALLCTQLQACGSSNSPSTEIEEPSIEEPPIIDPPVVAPPVEEPADDALVINWLGTTDSNWTFANNWSSNVVPGSATSDNAILTGNDIHAVVATPFSALLLNKIKISDGAYLLIEESIKVGDSIQLGAVNNLAGAELYQHADVIVSDSLRIGHLTTLTTPSRFTIEEGSLAIGNELFIRDGAFRVKGAQSNISANSMRVLSGGELIFDFDVSGITPINLAADFQIDDGAKLTIDLSGYTVGGNIVELVKFSSLQGNFDPSNVTITGLTGAKVNYTDNSLTISIVDKEQAPVSNLWFKAQPGTTNASDLEVNTGRIIRNLSSTALNYNQATDDGNDLVYAVSWNGSDFDGDSANDTISFDLRVKGFSNSTYVYSADKGNSSVSLGDTNSASAVNSLWGAGTDSDFDAGESLKFTVENVAFSVAGYSAIVDGFLSFRLDEVSGHTHQLILGEGSELDSVVNNSPKDFGLNAVTPLIITGAGSGTSAMPSIGNVSFKISIFDSLNPSNTAQLIDEADYSSFAVGPTFTSHYPAETEFENYPEFSWDKVPRWASVNGDMTEAQAELIAKNHDVISLGGFQDEDESIAEAALLKKYNPNIKTLFYINTAINFADFDTADASYDAENWNRYELDSDGERVYAKIRAYFEYNHNYPEMSDWWVALLVHMASQPEIDGVFIDKGHSNFEFINAKGEFVKPETGANRSYYELSQQVPSGSLLMSNSLRNEKPGGNRRMMEIMTGSYIERWDLPYADSPVAQTQTEAISVSIQLMREAAVKGKLLLPALHDRPSDAYINELLDAGKEAQLLAEIQEDVTLQLAYYLIIAEKYTYFRYQPDQNVEKYPEFVWDPTAYVEELTKPLGAPEGPPVKDGYIYTRSFEHVDVWLNIETNEAKLTWR